MVSAPTDPQTWLAGLDATTPVTTYSHDPEASVTTIVDENDSDYNLQVVMTNFAGSQTDETTEEVTVTWGVAWNVQLGTTTVTDATSSTQQWAAWFSPVWNKVNTDGYINYICSADGATSSSTEADVTFTTKATTTTAMTGLTDPTVADVLGEGDDVTFTDTDSKQLSEGALTVQSSTDWSTMQCQQTRV